MRRVEDIRVRPQIQRIAVRFQGHDQLPDALVRPEDIGPLGDELIVRDFDIAELANLLRERLGTQESTFELVEELGEASVHEPFAELVRREPDPLAEPFAEDEVIEMSDDVPEIEEDAVIRRLHLARSSSVG